MDRLVTAVIDACVLYSAPVRDLVIRLAQADLLRPRWTADIHGEWMRSVLSNNPHISRDRLERTRQLMDVAVRDCLVTEHSVLVDSLTLPDPDDRHVLAAAIQGEAEVIVTYNLADFPADALARFNIEVLHLKNPPKNVEEFLTTLETAELHQTVARLRACAERL
jgi:predicted nucleic acid-binding protein